MVFDTSGVPAGATITGAVLTLYFGTLVNNTAWSTAQTAFSVLKSFPASDTAIVAADYNKIAVKGEPGYSSAVRRANDTLYSAVTAGAYNNITLIDTDSDGYSYIGKGAGGVCRLGFAVGCDADDSEPTWAGNGIKVLYPLYFAGVGYLPVLTVTYTTDVTVTVPALDGNLDIPVPAVEVSGGGTIIVPALNGDLDVPVPAIASGVSITVPALEGTLDIPVPGINRKIINPYDFTPSLRLKIQLHDHTTVSFDATKTTADTIALYYADGYAALGISEHQLSTDIPGTAKLNWPWPSNPGMTAIEGVEVSPAHWHCGSHFCAYLATDVNQFTETHAEFNTIIAGVVAAGGIAIVNHPNWSGLVLADLQAFTGFVGIEIYNRHCDVANFTAHALDRWDEYLSTGARTWGFASDDAHGPSYEYDRGRNIVIADSASAANIQNAIVSGNFWSVEGLAGNIPLNFTDISLSGNTLTVTVDSSATIRFIGNNATVLKTESGVTTSSYTIVGNEKYVRIEAQTADYVTYPSTPAGYKIYSNPIMVLESAVEVPPIEGTLDIPVPSIASGVALTAPALDGTLDAPVPGVGISEVPVNITAPGIEGTLDIPVPAVLAGINLSVPVAEGTLDIPVPSIAAGVNIIVPALDVVADIPAPNVAAAAIIVVPVIESSLDIPVPSLAAGVNVSVPAIEVMGDVPVPSMIGPSTFLGSPIRKDGITRTPIRKDGKV